eukprot:TRINITY_DN8830_c0_g1_i1.p1 TRINITY_DN8830_c0_g1~~TRINITY_DN8830_c0_g1_i1.p1  ORF type:complete len:308 (+),score=65.57 TRINITY_DN8830_c0_g1_i1:151-1074(+)
MLSRCLSRASTAARDVLPRASRLPFCQIIFRSQCTRSCRPRRLTVLLDIDETLVHSEFNQCSHLKAPLDEVKGDPGTQTWDGPPVEQLELQIEGNTLVTVNKRPGLDLFLQRLTERRGKDGFRVVTFTAAASEYASVLIDVLLDPDGDLLAGQFDRSSCTMEGSQYRKDIELVIQKLRDQDQAVRDLKQASSGGILTRMRHSLQDPITVINSIAGKKQQYVSSKDLYWDGEKLDLSRTVLVDNNLQCHAMFPQNGMLVPSFFNDPSDVQLEKVFEELVTLLEASDASGAPADVKDILRDSQFAVPAS